MALSVEWKENTTAVNFEFIRRACYKTSTSINTIFRGLFTALKLHCLDDLSREISNTFYPVNFWIKRSIFEVVSTKFNIKKYS